MSFLKRRARIKAEISMLNLIDVIFMLLIFFMIATTFNHYAQFQVSVPKSNVKIDSNEVINPEIIISRDKKYYFKLENSIKESSLEEIKKEISEMDKEILGGITLTADEYLEYKVIVETMGLLKNQGVENINLNIQRNNN